MKNTKQEGRFRVFFYPYNGELVGVCPEFGIIHKGESLPDMKKEMFEAIGDYLNSVRELNLDDKELNKKVSRIHFLYFYWYSLVTQIQNTCNITERWTESGGQLEMC